MVVAELDGTISKVVHKKGHDPMLKKIGSVPASFIAPAVDMGPKGRVYVLTPGANPEDPSSAPPGIATLYYLKHGKTVKIADIKAYQNTDPDKDDLEKNPTDSNPFGLNVLPDRSVLVSDAAANEVIRVWPNGKIVTVAHLKPRTVEPPAGIPDLPAEMPSEAVATSVTVGNDGYWYIGELRGFPATPGTSQIWRVKAGTTEAVCDPENPNKGACKRFADGFTSIVDLAADDHGNIYVLELSKMSWLAIESEEPVPGAQEGALFKLSDHGKHRTELAAGKLMLPGNVDVDDHHVFVSHPVFGPGMVSMLD